jgi:hypothetical protein
MKRRTAIQHDFVEFTPEILEEGVLYITIKYATASHLCFCGCGHKVVTPITPYDWTLLFDGDTVSLHPSVGSWNLPCRSHYWIRNDKLIWAGQWSQRQIDEAKNMDRIVTDRYFGAVSAQPDPQPVVIPQETFLQRAKKFLGWR